MHAPNKLLTHRVLCVKLYANAKAVKYPGPGPGLGMAMAMGLCMGQRAGLRRAPSKATRESKQTNNRINRYTGK